MATLVNKSRCMSCGKVNPSAPLEYSLCQSSGVAVVIICDGCKTKRRLQQLDEMKQRQLDEELDNLDLTSGLPF